MTEGDESVDDCSDVLSPGATRRTFLSVALFGGTTVGLGRSFQSDGTEPRQIELGGEVPGWVGREPADIEDETNPTLTLVPGQTYEVTWENVDGVPHNIAFLDDEGEAIVSTEIISEEGTTQTVEFEATEAMAEYVCDVHPNTMRGDVSIEEDEETPATETPTETEEETPTETEAETPTETEEETPEETPEEPTAEFRPEIVEEEIGDVATITLSLDGTDRAEVVIGEEEVNYVIEFTAVDGDGDGEVTLAFDTFVAGRGDEPGIRAVGDEDEIRDYQQRTPILDDPLEDVIYLVRARVDERVVTSGLLALQSRETEAAYSGVAQRRARPSRPDDFVEQITRRDEVATDDWVVVEVEASGIYATLDDASDFEDESLGYELAIEETEALNREPDRVPMEDIRLVTDAENDRFFAVVDSDTLRTGETYEATFAITDANPYVPEGRRESVSTTFSVIERTATFDLEDDVLSVPPAETTITGTTTIAPGSIAALSVTGTQNPPRLHKLSLVTVDEDGSWSSTVDFSDVEEGTTFSARVVGLTDVVRGRVTSEESEGT